MSCPAPLQLLPIQTQCFNEIGGFIPNKNPWVLPLEFQWGKSLGSPFNNPSCGRANGSLGVPEIAGVWLVLRDSIWKMLCFLDVCQWSFYFNFCHGSKLPVVKIQCLGLFFSKRNTIFHKFPSSILHFHLSMSQQRLLCWSFIFMTSKAFTRNFLQQRWTLIAKAPASSMRCLSSDEKNGFRVAMTVNKKGSGSIGFDFVWKFNHHI